MTSTLPSASRLFTVALPLVFALPACFGDWVNARPRPKRDAPVQAATPSHDSGTPMPDDPCPAYLATVAKHCDRVLQGQPQSTPCHAQLMRLMSIFETSKEGPWDEGCATHLAATPPSTPNVEPVQLGPHCRQWAKLIHARCVRPLSTIPPALHSCGAELLAFESTLGAITFGHAEDHEPQCEAAAAQLVAPAEP